MSRMTLLPGLVVMLVASCHAQQVVDMMTLNQYTYIYNMVQVPANTVLLPLAPIPLLHPLQPHTYSLVAPAEGGTSKNDPCLELLLPIVTVIF